MIGVVQTHGKDARRRRHRAVQLHIAQGKIAAASAAGGLHGLVAGCQKGVHVPSGDGADIGDALTVEDSQAQLFGIARRAESDQAHDKNCYRRSPALSPAALTSAPP